MSDFNIQFEEQDQSITLEFEQIGGGAVKSVNGKTGVVVLTASDVGALPTSTPIPTVDNTLTTAGAAADAKKTGDEIATVKDGLSDMDDRVTALEEGGSGSGLTEDIKAAMLQIAQKVAYIDEHGQTYYDALYGALYPPADLVSISAVYTQSGTVYDTDSLDSLKSDLVVTAHMSDSTTRTVTTYTLSGTLAEGTSTVTVTYGGKTTTFTVTVTHAQDVPSGYTQYDYITYDYAFGTLNINNTITTDISMTADYILDTSFSYKNDGGSAENKSECVLGSRHGQSGTKQIALFVNRTTTKLGYWYGGTDTTNTINLAQGVVNHVIIQPVGVSEDYPNNATINLNGTDYNTGSTTTSIVWSPWFSFFGYGTSASGSQNSTNKYELKIGRTTIKDLNNNTLYDFIPAYDGTNYGLYEKINQKFYIGQDPSHFVCGNWS